MENMCEVYLCGGIFLDLLLRKKPEGESKREELANKGKSLYDRKRIKNNQPDMLLDLIRMFYPNFNWPGDRASSECSSYRNCEKNSTIYLPFDKKSEIDSFDERVRTQYQSELKKMHDTITLRLNIKSEADMLELTRQMLDYIKRDSDVKDDERFYATRDGRGLTREELLSESNYCLDALLLGVWHYILMHRFDNKKGQRIREAWYQPKGDSGTKYDLVEPLGKGCSESVSYYLWNENDVPVSEEQESPSVHAEESDAPDMKALGSEEDEEKAETIEGEVVDDDEFQSERNKKESNNFGGQGVTFNNNGDGDMFCFVGTVNNYGK